MKQKLFALLLCMVFICTLSLPVYADSATTSSDGYSVLISDIPKVCPTCGSKLHAKWFSTSGAEVELSISDNGTIKIPAGSGVYAKITLYCTNCKYEKTEHRILGLDWGSEHPGVWNVKKAPTGIGRKDLPGYADDKGIPSVDPDGYPTATYTMLLDGYDTSAGCNTVNVHNFSNKSNPNSWFDYTNGSYTCSDGSVDVYGVYGDSNNRTVSAAVSYYLIAPDTGYYTINANPATFSCSVKDSSGSYYTKYSNDSYVQSFAGFFDCVAIKTPRTDWNSIVWVNDSKGRNPLTWCYQSKSRYAKKGDLLFFVYNACFSTAIGPVYPYRQLSIKTTTPTLTFKGFSSTQIVNNNSITINNNTWNGNIYTDNSTNLTYIYPQYTTINEKNETVTNISNTPIIYNNETKQYYTYDTATNNYYYITYEQPATPTPSPSPSPAPSEFPTPDPGTTPTPTPKPSGDISTPETGKPGGSSGSGQSWWDKLLDKIGDAVIDGLLGAVSAVLKLIFKLLSTILGWIIWLVSQVLTLFPFLPPGLGALLIGGVVVCFVIGIIKFIRG